MSGYNGMPQNQYGQSYNQGNYSNVNANVMQMPHNGMQMPPPNNMQMPPNNMGGYPQQGQSGGGGPSSDILALLQKGGHGTGGMVGHPQQQQMQQQRMQFDMNDFPSLGASNRSQGQSLMNSGNNMGSMASNLQQQQQHRVKQEFSMSRENFPALGGGSNATSKKSSLDSGSSMSSAQGSAGVGGDNRSSNAHSTSSSINKTVSVSANGTDSNMNSLRLNNGTIVDGGSNSSRISSNDNNSSSNRGGVDVSGGGLSSMGSQGPFAQALQDMNGGGDTNPTSVGSQNLLQLLQGNKNTKSNDNNIPMQQQVQNKMMKPLGNVESSSSTTTGGREATSSSSTTGDDKSNEFRLLGLVKMLRMTNPDVNTLALGTDLTALGLDLNSSECLYATFASPWALKPSTLTPQFSLPTCYYMQPPQLNLGHFKKFHLETLFYIFYAMPKDVLQVYASQELLARNWRYHKMHKLWFVQATAQDGVPPNPSGGPQLIYFEITTWERRLFQGDVDEVQKGLLSHADFAKESSMASMAAAAAGSGGGGVNTNATGNTLSSGSS
eukprot:g814.t1